MGGKVTVEKEKRREENMAKQACSEIVKEGERLWAHVRGEIDHHSAKPLREGIDQSMRRERPRVLVLDLGEVSFMDSSGLGFVLGRIALAEEMDCRVEIRRSSERILRILSMGGIGKIKNAIVCREKEKDERKGG
jgi:stage II sporulation protein AA (anti-sigma F factor antagonist)